MHMGFGAETGVCGRIVQTDFRDAAGNLIRSVPQDVVVQA